MTYNFKCNKCSKKRTVTCKMSELDEHKPAKCSCGGKYQQEYGNVGIVWKTDGACGKVG